MLGLPWAMMLVVDAEPDQPDRENKQRNHHIIGLGEPGGQPYCAEHDGQQRRGATDRRDHRANNAGCKEGAVAHASQLFGAEGYPASVVARVSAGTSVRVSS